MKNADHEKRPNSKEDVLADEFLLRALAIEAMVTPESVTRALQGFRMRLLTRERIRRALAARGLDAFLPAQPPLPLRKRPRDGVAP